jgi:hypothetical protein
VVGVDLGVFGDIGVDGDDDPRAGEPHDDEPAAGGSAPARLRRARAGIAAGLVLLCGLSAWGATTETEARQHRATLVSAPGGVLSLARPVSAAWDVPADSTHLPAFMPGLVVVQRGGVLHGLDVGTGTERWQVQVGEGAGCGLMPAGAQNQNPPVADPLVCLAAQPDGRRIVTVVRANGASETRELPQDVTTAVPTAAGDLVTIRRTGPTPPPPDAHVIGTVNGDGVTGSSGFLHVEGSVAAGQDAVVRLEDAATGTPRWERTLTFTPVADASTCGGTIVVASDNQATFDPTRLEVSTLSSFVVVLGCGIQGVFTATGEPVDRASPKAAVSVWQPYADGGVLRYDTDIAAGSQTQTLLRPDGTTTAFTDRVLSPLATDGTHPDVVLLAANDQSLHARDRAGSPLWTNTLPVPDVLARTSRVAVVAIGFGVAGIDLTSGKTLWMDPTSFLESTSTTRNRTHDATDLGNSSSLSVAAAFTDGDSVTLSMDYSDGATHGFVTLDPATGDVRWRTLTPASANDWTQYYAVEGHVISLTVSAPTPGGAPTSATVTAWH